MEEFLIPPKTSKNFKINEFGRAEIVKMYFWNIENRYFCRHDWLPHDLGERLFKIPKK